METSNTPKDKKGIKKLWSKVKTHIRSGSISSTSPTTQTTDSLTTQPTPAPVAAAAPAPVLIPEQPKAESAPPQPILEAEPMPPTEKDEATKRFERAQAIFQKYDLELNPEDWNMPSKGNVERVQKPVRMRVKWTCHECKTIFGHDKICKQCSHSRCKECIRYPPKKPKERTGVKDKLAPTPKTPTKGPCHECRTEFEIGATECSNCHHQICDKCLKEAVIDSPATAPPPAAPVSVSAA